MTNFHELLSALKALTTTAAAVENKLHAGFKPSQISAERSQLYNAINTAKAVIYAAEATEVDPVNANAFRE